MAYVDFLSDHRPPLRYGGGREHSLFLPPPGLPHHFMPPPPPSSLPPSSSHPPPPSAVLSSLCPLCFLPFNPAMSYSGTCPNCTFKLPPPPPPHPPPPSSRHYDLRQQPQSKKSTSSLSSSGSSSSSVTSPEFNNDPFLMTTMLNVVDDVLREEVSLCLVCGSQEHLSFCLDCQKHICSVPCATSYHPFDHHVITNNHLPYKHLKTSLSPPPPPPSRALQKSYKHSCDRHFGKPMLYFCRPCLSTLCYECISEGHLKHPHITINEAYRQIQPHLEPNLIRDRIAALDKLSEDIEKVKSSVIKKEGETIAAIHRAFKQQQEELAKREKAVVSVVASIRTKRLESLDKETEVIDSSRKALRDLSLQLKTTSPEESAPMVVSTHYKINKELEMLNLTDKDPLTSQRPCIEDDSFIVLPNNSVIKSAIDTFCEVTTAPYPPLCTATGDGLFHPHTNRLSSVILTTKDRMGGACNEGGERVIATLSHVNVGSASVPVDVRDNMDGTYTINMRPRSKGEHLLSVTIRGHHVKGSPFQLMVEGEREYGRVGVVSQVFGAEGSGPGEFCRPWGICCDQKGNIIIGDRSNHRIQVFSSNGTFLHTFGSEGRQTGQFNRPAGVAVTREGHIVVADKDNHRIQVFQFDGTFLFTFGKKGGKDGEMVYPYDVAVSPVDGRIVTTDTGNHRILIFSHDGHLLGKFGYKGYLCNHFDSPRGIAINQEGHIIVSDFNVHHILVIHPDGTTARILGSHGSGNTQFTRPQGIAVDHTGNFIVADTRNNRIVIMHPSGQFIAKFGTAGSARGQFDRPTTVTVLPDGRIAVMDFGNSRIQIF